MNQYSGALKASILAAAARPFGMAATCIDGYSLKQVARMVQKLQAAKLLHRANVSGKFGRYFNTPERAEEYAKAYAPGRKAAISADRPRQRGDRQLRVDDAFDTARAVAENAARLRNSNRCKADAVIPEGLKPVELPNTLRDRFTPDEVPPLFSSLRPGQYIAPAPAWVEAATA